MKALRKFLTTVTLATALLSSIGAKTAVLFPSEFQLHDFDEAIAKSLGYESVMILYFKEMGALMQNELTMRKEHEAIGCYPFYVMSDGEVQDLGYNCGSFFCTGYERGPKQCKDRSGNPYGGIAEISKRFTLPMLTDIKRYYDSFPLSEQTDQMKSRMQQLAAIRCKPFYLLRYDMAVGEGYDCDQLGKYPYYSAKNTCINDWRTSNGTVCTVPLRPDEFRKREEAIAHYSSSSSSTSAAVAVDTSSSSGSTVEEEATSFPDIEEGKYGFTAIITLAGEGVLTGYDDGMFRPLSSINRAEFMTVLMRTIQDETGSGSNCFTDVSNEWFAPSVCAAKEHGFIQGFLDGSFQPSKPVTKAEAMKVVVSAFSISSSGSSTTLPTGVDENQWFTPFIRTAVEQDILREISFSPHVPATRADTAVWIYRARNVRALETESQ